MATRSYGIFWRWHFLAGLFACPVIFIVALTGALYTFQPELEDALKHDIRLVEPVGSKKSLDELSRALPSSCVPTWYNVPADADRSVAIGCKNESEYMLDPYRGTVLGDGKSHWFFHVVFWLHWELLLGEPGRVIIEWATSWTLLLLLSGVYLWWPRGKSGGAWWPRKGVRQRQFLRDLHAVIGAYSVPVLVAITTTGLFWTAWFGHGRWHPLHEDDPAHVAYENPPKSPLPQAGAQRIGLQQVLDASGQQTGGRSVYIVVPDKPDMSFVLYSWDPSFKDPSNSGAAFVHAYTGERQKEFGWDDATTFAKIDRYGYSIHVGAVLGWPGRILACIAALVLAALTITGPWMWWKRRPRGGLGVPGRPKKIPVALYVVLAGLGWLLPAVGWTLIAVVVFEGSRWLWLKLRDRTATEAP